jgi:hypothetical protein
MTNSRPTVQQHFDNREAEVKAIYGAILKAAHKLGPVCEDPKKTSIHLVRRTAFAGIATRKSALILTLKAAADMPSKRILKREQVSANRWHVEIKLEKQGDVDRELVGWLKNAYDLAE